ncbi:hypothetical protein [Ruminococcus sp.]|uniref:hypothetical protein n=1 Tax=Ruminococcus sp. TaxID=41978 RepID=UPI0025D676B5|nr:hypothetical protein [Ruminococcus sp.]MCR4639258.1 hypothetical protein [Ruminococcus sp.]
MKNSSKEIDFGIMENADIKELASLSEKVQPVSDDEKKKILEMSRKKYDIRKKDNSELHEEYVSGSEPYRPRTLWKVLSAAAACTVLIGGIAGSVYLMKDRTPNNKNEHSSSASEPASLGEEGSIFDAVSWDRMRCTPFPDYAMIYEIPEDIAQKTGEALKSGQWNEMPDDTKLDISPVSLFIYNQGTPFRLDMYLIGEDYTSEGWLENSDFYIMFDNGEMKKLFKGDNTAKKAFELIYTLDIYSNNYIEVEEPFDDMIHKVWDYTETYESVPHMSYSADEVDLTSYDMTDTEGIVGRMLNNFHYCDKISGELIAPDSITSFQFDISADTGFWTQEPFHVNIISNDIMDENWYEIGEPYLSSNGYRSNINYLFEGKALYSNTDSALYGEEFPGNTNMSGLRNYKFDRDSCYFKADEFIEYNKDKTTLSEDDFEKKYKNSTIYNTLIRNDCVYKGAPFSALSQLCSIDISSMKVEDGKTYMGRECLLLRADIPDRYKAPLTYSQESYSDGVHDETGDFIYNPMSLVDYTEMLVDKETGVVLKQLFLNENGEAVFATGYSEIAFNENAKPLPDTEFTHPY